MLSFPQLLQQLLVKDPLSTSTSLLLAQDTICSNQEAEASAEVACPERLRGHSIEDMQSCMRNRFQPSC